MSNPHLASNPFALMMFPEAIFAAIEHSDRLRRLKSRICRPLDGPRPPQAAEELAAFDEAVEATIEVPETLAADEVSNGHREAEEAIPGNVAIQADPNFSA